MTFLLIIFPEGMNLNCHARIVNLNHFGKGKTGWSLHILNNSISPNSFLCKFASWQLIHVSHVFFINRTKFYFFIQHTVQLKSSIQVDSREGKEISSPGNLQSTNLKVQLVKETDHCPGSRQKIIWVLSTDIPRKSSFKGFTDLEERKARLLATD